MKNSKILLDTNIIIHREAEKIINPEIGKLFNALDKIHTQKFIHPVTKREINKLVNEEKKYSFNIKLDSYTELITKETLNKDVENISKKYDLNDNDKNDTLLLNEVYSGTVDFLITEDKKIHNKSKELNIADKVFTIESFLERVAIEFPELTEYKVLSVHKSYFGNVDLNDDFFKSFKEDYPGFEKWFKKKSNEPVYISTSDDNKLCAFLYLKLEDQNENYLDIEPILPPKNKRLKIGTFKEELKKWWNYNNIQPFLINFLHVYSLTPEQRSKLIRKRLLELGILTGEDNEIRGLKEITKENFKTIIKEASINESYFIY